jgi:hypothetical protein
VAPSRGVEDSAPATHARHLTNRELIRGLFLIDRFAAARVHALFPESGKSREELKPGLRRPGLYADL